MNLKAQGPHRVGIGLHPCVDQDGFPERCGQRTPAHCDPSSAPRNQSVQNTLGWGALSQTSDLEGRPGTSSHCHDPPNPDQQLSLGQTPRASFCPQVVQIVSGNGHCGDGSLPHVCHQLAPIVLYIKPPSHAGPTPGLPCSHFRIPVSWFPATLLLDLLSCCETAYSPGTSGKRAYSRLILGDLACLKMSFFSSPHLRFFWVYTSR